MLYETFKIAIIYQGKRRVLNVTHQAGAAVDIYKVSGKNRAIELQTNYPFIKRMKRSKTHYWKIFGYIEDKKVKNDIIKAIETHWKNTKA